MAHAYAFHWPYNASPPRLAASLNQSLQKFVYSLNGEVIDYGSSFREHPGGCTATSDAAPMPAHREQTPGPHIAAPERRQLTDCYLTR